MHFIHICIDVLMYNTIMTRHFTIICIMIFWQFFKKYILIRFLVLLSFILFCCFVLFYFCFTLFVCFCMLLFVFCFYGLVCYVMLWYRTNHLNVLLNSQINNVCLIFPVYAGIEHRMQAKSKLLNSKTGSQKTFQNDFQTVIVILWISIKT